MSGRRSIMREQKSLPAAGEQYAGSQNLPSVPEAVTSASRTYASITLAISLRAIATLTARGVEGAIVGKALYAGRFTLPEALAAMGQ